MAKEDFCFTYYDGDAARDMAHMNRLERGGYNDLIVSQRKFGHLSLSLIKKTLGNDFDSTWPALEIILKKDAAGNFFIEWLEVSIEKMRRQAMHQSVNGKKGGRPKTQMKPNSNPTTNPNETPEKPLGNGYEDGYEDEIKNGSEAERFLIPKMFETFKRLIPRYPGSKIKDFKPLYSIAQYLCEIGQLNGPPESHSERIIEAWEPICTTIAGDNFYKQKTLLTISNHIQEITQNALHGKPKGKNDQQGDLRNRVSAELNRRDSQSR